MYRALKFSISRAGLIYLLFEINHVFLRSYNWDDMAYKSYVDEMESQTHIDAEWKRIQEKTFTRWCNEQLKEANITLTDLSADLCNGVNLIILLEFLSQKKLGRYNKKPRIHAQKMENVEKSLNFITKEEGIRLVNIGKRWIHCTVNTL